MDMTKYEAAMRPGYWARWNKDVQSKIDRDIETNRKADGRFCVDDCGARGEPSVSGLFSRDMESKPAYFVLDDLINREWRTNTCVKAGKDGSVEFRGFRGTYRLSWEDRTGIRSAEVVLH